MSGEEVEDREREDLTRHNPCRDGKGASRSQMEREKALLKEY